MALHWTEKETARLNVGLMLKERGWQLDGFYAGCTTGIEYAPPRWHGTATHPKYPKATAEVDTSRTPKGKAWAVFVGETAIASGVGLQGCYGGSNEARVRRATGAVADAIEQAARMTDRITVGRINTAAPSDFANRPSPSPAASTDAYVGEATVGGVTIRSQLIDGKNPGQKWTLIDHPEPRLPPAVYYEWAEKFGIERYRKAYRKLICWRAIGADELGYFFAPPAEQPDAPRMKMPEAELPDLRPAAPWPKLPENAKTPEAPEAPEEDFTPVQPPIQYLRDTFYAAPWGNASHAATAAIKRAEELRGLGWLASAYKAPAAGTCGLVDANDPSFTGFKSYPQNGIDYRNHQVIWVLTPESYHKRYMPPRFDPAAVAAGETEAEEAPMNTAATSDPAEPAADAPASKGAMWFDEYYYASIWGTWQKAQKAAEARYDELTGLGWNCVIKKMSMKPGRILAVCNPAFKGGITMTVGNEDEDGNVVVFRPQPDGTGYGPTWPAGQPDITTVAATPNTSTATPAAEEEDEDRIDEISPADTRYILAADGANLGELRDLVVEVVNGHAIIRTTEEEVPEALAYLTERTAFVTSDSFRYKLDAKALAKVSDAPKAAEVVNEVGELAFIEVYRTSDWQNGWNVRRAIIARMALLRARGWEIRCSLMEQPFAQMVNTQETHYIFARRPGLGVEQPVVKPVKRGYIREATALAAGPLTKLTPEGTSASRVYAVQIVVDGYADLGVYESFVIERRKGMALLQFHCSSKLDYPEAYAAQAALKAQGIWTEDFCYMPDAAKQYVDQKPERPAPETPAAAAEIAAPKPTAPAAQETYISASADGDYRAFEHLVAGTAGGYVIFRVPADEAEALITGLRQHGVTTSTFRWGSLESAQSAADGLPFPTIAHLVDEAAYPCFTEVYAPLAWKSEEVALRAMNARKALLEEAGWQVVTDFVIDPLGPTGVGRTGSLTANVPGYMGMPEVRQVVKAGCIRSKTARAVPVQAPVAEEFRYLLVKKGSGELYNDVDSGATDIELSEDYCVLEVMADQAEYLMTLIRSGMGHLSRTIYTSKEEAHADAPNHVLRPTASPAPAPAVQAAAAPAAQPEPKTDPYALGTRTHFYEAFFLSDWDTGPKAKKAAEGRAAELQAIGWKTEVSRKRGEDYYTVSAFDPNVQIFTTAVQVLGSRFETRDGNGWLLWSRQTPGSLAALRATGTPADDDETPHPVETAPAADETPRPVEATPAAPEPTPAPNAKVMVWSGRKARKGKAAGVVQTALI
ncbi:MAG: hypothetical protein HGA45_10400 [Chloroflexales bacterium]|nr:hypothetical protein [Chloroflexales bacterium]